MNKLQVFFLALFVAFVPLQAIAKTAVIKKETAVYVIDIQYPQGFASDEMNASIKELIDSIQTEYAAVKQTNTDLPKNVSGKNGLYITYKTVYQTKQITSLQFNISVFFKGAAHPNNVIRTLNFVDGRKVVLAQLFKPESNYLAKISSLCRDNLLAKKDADEKWVLTGTAPTDENYRNWYFNKSGLTMIFDTYQVAAYVYGPQLVSIPTRVIHELIQPEFKKRIWGY